MILVCKHALWHISILKRPYYISTWTEMKDLSYNMNVSTQVLSTCVLALLLKDHSFDHLSSIHSIMAPQMLRVIIIRQVIRLHLHMFPDGSVQLSVSTISTWNCSLFLISHSILVRLQSSSDGSILPILVSTSWDFSLGSEYLFLIIFVIECYDLDSMLLICREIRTHGTM